MRISESELRNIIKKTMNEMHHEVFELPQLQHVDHVESDHSLSGEHSFLEKAQKCIKMAHHDLSKLSDMCIQICAASDRSLMAKCIELCVCACKCDVEGCCACLTQICSDPRCAQICEECCGC